MKRSDEGVTLIELLVVVSISGVIAVAIAAAFAVGVKTTDAANERLAGSQGAQLTTSFFPSDVRSWNLAAPTAACLTGTLVHSFGWTDTDSADTAVAKTANYCLVPAGSQTDLIREFTSGGTMTESTVAYDVTGTPVVTCLPSCATPTTATISVTESGGYTFSVTGRRRAA